MARRLNAEEARSRVIDTINLLKDAESADLDKYMCKYAVYRDLQENSPEEYEAEYTMISRALFGHPEENPRREDDPQKEEVPQEPEILTVEVEEIPQEPEILEPAVIPQILPDTPEYIPPEKIGPDPVDSWEAVVNIWISLTALAEVLAEEISPRVGAAWTACSPLLRKAPSVALRATRKALTGAKVLGIHLAGWGACLALLGGSMAVSVARAARDGWNMRQEIMQDMAA